MEFETVKLKSESNQSQIEFENTELKTDTLNNLIKEVEKTETNPKGAGRHKANCDCDKCKLKRGEKTDEKIKKVENQTSNNNQTVNSNTISPNEFEKVVSEYQTTKQVIQNGSVANNPNNGLNQPPSVQPILISGYVFLICIDAVIPALVIKLFKYINKKAANLEAKDIKLDKDQLKALEPIADQAAKIIFENMHPVSALFLGLGFIYIGNTMAVLDEK